MRNGRPLRPSKDEPGVAWLVRAIRAGHPDPPVHDTHEFAAGLRRHGLRCTAETVNKWEAGGKHFPPARCLAYEQALRLPAGTLVDVGCYLRRLADEDGGAGPFPVKQITAPDTRLLTELTADGTLPALDWLRLAGLLACHPDILTGNPRLRDTVDAAFVGDLARSFETDERLMLEAAAVMGDLVLPRLVELVGPSAPFLFNLVETLGHVPTTASARALRKALPMLSDDFVAPNLVEAATRLARSATGLLEETTGVLPDITAYALEAARTQHLSFMAREEAVEFLYAGTVTLSPAERRKLADTRPAYLDLRPSQDRMYETALGDLVAGRLRQEFRNLGPPTRRPDDYTGLKALVMRALTGPTRRDRLAAGSSSARGPTGPRSPAPPTQC